MNEAKLIAEVTVLTEMVRVLSDRIAEREQRTWVGLTNEDLAVCGDEDDVMLARYWERVCKEKNK
jgi:hypothetical protein